MPEEIVPASVAEYRDYFERVRPRLCVSEPARAAIDFVLHPPMTRELLPLQLPLRVTAAAALAIVPRDLRVMAGIDRSRTRGHAHRGRGAPGRRGARAAASARGACHGGRQADVGARLHASPPCRVNILSLPITLPAKAINRALEDLSTLASVARELPERLDRLDERAETIDERLENVMTLGEAIETQGQRVADLGERIDERGEQIVALGERIDEQGRKIAELGARVVEGGEHVTELGERIDARGEQVLEMGERFMKLAERGLEQSQEVADRAEEVAASGREVAAALPTLQRAVGLAEPLEGVVERMGKLADRLPGGARPPQPPPDPDTRAPDS